MWHITEEILCGASASAQKKGVTRTHYNHIYFNGTLMCIMQTLHRSRKTFARHNIVDYWRFSLYLFLYFPFISSMSFSAAAHVTMWDNLYRIESIELYFVISFAQFISIVYWFDVIYLCISHFAFTKPLFSTLKRTFILVFDKSNVRERYKIICKQTTTNHAHLQ